MSHIPYGYKIVDGMAEVDEEQAKKVRMFFEFYIDGLSLKAASEKVGFQIFHGSAGRMLRNRHYLGDDFYPAIITQEIFDKAEEVRKARAGNLGRVKELKQAEKPCIEQDFCMAQITKKFSDPFIQAEYLYSQIERKVANG